MSGAPHITVQFDLGDAAALPAVLRKRIGEVERHVAKVGDTIDGTELLLTRDFLGQLRRLLAAVEDQLPAKVPA